MKLQQFDGGLSTRMRPQFLQVNEGEVYTNIDNAKGTLSSVADAKETVITATKYAHYFEAEDTWVSNDRETSWVEYNNVLYYVDGVQPRKFDGDNTFNIGIATSDTAANTTEVPAVEPVTNAQITVVSPGNLTVRVESYILANSDGTLLSNPISFEVDATGTIVNLKLLSTNEALELVAPLNVSTSTATRNITIKNVSGATYGVGGVAVYRAYQGKYYLVGTLASSAATLIDNVEDISGNTELDLDLFSKLDGTYQYVYTYVNGFDGTESGPSPLSTALKANGAIQLTNVKNSTDPQVTKKNIYRIGGLSAAYTLVDTIDNFTQSYLDNTKDTDLKAQILETAEALPAPNELEHLVEANAMLFGSVGSQLRYTPIGQPNSWPALYFISYAEDITGLAPVANGLLVMTRYKTHLVTGTGPNSLATQVLRSDQGCVNHNSVQLYQGAAFWASTDGVCVSDGSNVTVLTKDKLGKLKLDTASSAMHDEVYYLLQTNGVILAVDMRFGTMFKNLELGVDSVVVGEDTLYGHSGGKLFELFASDNLVSMNFKSARLTEGYVSKEKAFKKFHFYSSGDIIIKIIGENDSLVGTVELSGTKRTEFQVPTSVQRQEFIQLEVTGRGEVYEIRYDAELV